MSDLNEESEGRISLIPVFKKISDLAECSVCMTGILNPDNDEEMFVEFGVDANDEQLVTMFTGLFSTMESAKDACREAILKADYGESDIDLDKLVN